MHQYSLSKVKFPLPKKKKYRVIGLMSGTSLDGLDIAFCEFSYRSNSWHFDLIAYDTVVYPELLLNELKSAEKQKKSVINKLDDNLGVYYGKLINDFIKVNSINNIDFISSHGHTVLHQPEIGITLQIGSGKRMVEKTGISVINDFRSNDVKLGGQGAPLVPVGDEMLFSKYAYCLNLGGIANISFNSDDERIAFDICPVNMALNNLSLIAGKQFDDNGDLARSGAINENLLKKLNEISFYEKKPPKSLGKEWFNTRFLPLITSCDDNVENKLSTVVEHVAYNISKTISKQGEILATGGGAFNNYLIERIKAATKNKIVLPTEEIINYKEAIIFGFLGVLKKEEIPNCLKSVTGSLKDNIGGVVHNE